jgi:DNA-binding NarL/FixJ family response regulator
MGPGNKLFSNEEWDILFKELALSSRQKEIMRLLFDGSSDKQIANHLQIAVPTVRTHLERLFTKFHAQDRTELVVEVLRKFRAGCRAYGESCPRWRHEYLKPA